MTFKSKLKSESTPKPNPKPKRNLNAHRLQKKLSRRHIWMSKLYVSITSYLIDFKPFNTPANLNSTPERLAYVCHAISNYFQY